MGGKRIKSFESCYIIEGDCWIWQRAKRDDGYGMIWDPIKKRVVRAHVFSWEKVNGPVPIGKELHHICERRDCVNDKHVTPKSRFAHVRASTKHNANKTHCPRNHEYTEKNTYYDCYNYRQCRTCNRENYRRSHPGVKIREGSKFQ